MFYFVHFIQIFLMSDQIVLLPKRAVISRMFSFFFLITDMSFNVVDGESQVSKELFQ